MFLRIWRWVLILWVLLLDFQVVPFPAPPPFSPQQDKGVVMKEVDGIKWLSTNEFMERFSGISRSTIYESLKDGSLPHIRLSKSKILIPEDAFERKFRSSYERTDLLGREIEEERN